MPYILEKGASLSALEMVWAAGTQLTVMLLMMVVVKKAATKRWMDWETASADLQKSLLFGSPALPQHVL